MKKKFILTACFSSIKFEDSLVIGLVGRPESGSGTNLRTGLRDLSFEFKEEGPAKKALTRIKKKGIKGEIQEIYYTR